MPQEEKPTEGAAAPAGSGGRSVRRLVRASYLAALAFLLGACQAGGYRLEAPRGEHRFLDGDRALLSAWNGSRAWKGSFDLARKRLQWSAEVGSPAAESVSNGGRFAIYAEGHGPDAHRIVRLDTTRGVLEALDLIYRYTDSIQRARLGETGPHEMHVSDDGELVALFVDREVRVYEASRPQEPVFKASFGELGGTLVRFAPGSSTLFVSVRDHEHRYIYVLERTPAGWALLAPFRGAQPTWTTRGLYYLVQGEIRCFCSGRHESIDPGTRYSRFVPTPDGKLVGSAANGGYSFLDVERGQNLPMIPLDIRSWGLKGDTLVALTNGGDLYRVNLRTTQRKKLRSFGVRSRSYRIPIPDMGGGVESFYDVMLGPDGRFVLYLDEKTRDTFVYDTTEM